MALPVEMDVLVSEVRSGSDGAFLDFSLEKRRTPTIEEPTDIVIRMEAAPINPSDIATIFGASDRFKAHQHRPNCISAPIAPELVDSMKVTVYGTSRAGGIVAGLEGSGLVVAAGASAKAQALLGKVVAVQAWGCYASYCRANLASNAVMPMPAGITPQQAASSFVNPMTVLGMYSTMREEGHTAVVHTAAASQLGQMMLRVAVRDNVPLVNVVRKAEQEALLRAIEPNAVCVNQSSPSFVDDLAQAIRAAGATLCFDATTGGPLTGQVLDAFERAGKLREGIQVYQYGWLDTSPSTLTSSQKKKVGKDFWTVMAWHSTHQKEWTENMQRVAQEITTTFQTKYTAEVGLAQAVTLPALAVYGKQETGKKYLLNPLKVAVAKL